MELVLRDRRVDVTDLSGRFKVTTETIRRDLTDLQQDRLVRRVHGGAVPWRSWVFEPQLEIRGSQNVEEKRRIARAALDLIPDRGSIIIDSGSTTAHLGDVLSRERKVTVVTNSIPIIEALAASEPIEVIVIGGRLRGSTMAAVDATGVDMLRDITVDVVFMSCDGMSPERGFTTPYRSEVAIKRAMMASARRVVSMFDHTKVGNDQLLRFASLRRGRCGHHRRRDRRGDCAAHRRARPDRHPCLTEPERPAPSTQRRSRPSPSTPRQVPPTCSVPRPDRPAPLPPSRLRQMS